MMTVGGTADKGKKIKTMPFVEIFKALLQVEC